MPIRWRLTLFNVLSIGTILLLLSLAIFVLVRHALLSGVEETTRERAFAAARTVESGRVLTREEAERLTLDGVFVVVRDVEGRILQQTVTSVPQGGGIRDQIWDEALQTGEPAGGPARYSPAAPDYVYAVPVNPPGGSARVVEAGKSYGPVEETLEVFGTVLAVAIGTALLVSIGGAYFLARTALRPMEAVVSAAREITETDLERRLPVANPNDEIGRLTSTINGLLARLETAFVRREEALARQRRFAADAGHELRTPLTSIKGYARMLRSWGLEDPGAAREAVDSILGEAGRMEALVESLLALARGDAGAPLEVGPGDLGGVVAEAVRAARASAGGKVSIEYACPKSPVAALFDRARIRQVASILLDNAIKYTPEGGTVRVKVKEEGGWTRLEVSDTGVGIPPEELPMVFERFYRVDESRSDGGAGLGLSIARQIAEAHGGKIRAESVPGEGATFILRIPTA